LNHDYTQMIKIVCVLKEWCDPYPDKVKPLPVWKILDATGISLSDIPHGSGLYPI
jgi:hypothetical protein